MTKSLPCASKLVLDPGRSSCQPSSVQPKRVDMQAKCTGSMTVSCGMKLHRHAVRKSAPSFRACWICTLQQSQTNAPCESEHQVTWDPGSLLTAKCRSNVLKLYAAMSSTCHWVLVQILQLISMACIKCDRAVTSANVLPAGSASPACTPTDSAPMWLWVASLCFTAC